MTEKDPKDMTAAELLRWTANGDPDEHGNTNVVFKLFTALGNKSYSDTAYEEDARNICALAAKIDTEIEAARRNLFKATLDERIELHGYPSRRKGEPFVRWLERCWLLRPRDEAGEPVQFGDDDIDWDYTDECRVPGAQLNATAVDIRGKLLATTFNKIVAVAETDERDRVKRLAPEVMGADGKPIVEGETAWDTKSGLEIVVSRIAKDEGGNVIVCANGDICELQFFPKDITHIRPDTQDRIDADARKYFDEYWCCIDASCSRCPSKIDGKKPKERFDTRHCSQAIVFDLLRRQRELDARKGGAE